MSTKRIATLNRGRGGAGYRQKRCFLKLQKDADRKRLFCSNVSTLLSMIVGPVGHHGHLSHLGHLGHLTHPGHLSQVSHLGYLTRPGHLSHVNHMGHLTHLGTRVICVIRVICVSWVGWYI